MTFGADNPDWALLSPMVEMFVVSDVSDVLEHIGAGRGGIDDDFALTVRAEVRFEQRTVSHHHDTAG